MGKSARIALPVLLALLLGGMRQTQPPPGISVFAAANPWNWDITGLAVHPNSANYISAIGAAAPIREDYSFQYSLVNNGQADVSIPFTQYPDESDPGPTFGSPANGTLGTGSAGSYPFPPGAPIESG